MTNPVSQRVHIVGVGSEPRLGIRLKEVATEFDYGLELFESIDTYAKQMREQDTAIVVFSALSIDRPQEIAGHVQVVRQVCQDAYVLVVMDKKMSPEDAAFVKRSGANLVMLDDNFFQTSQLEYACYQMIRGSMIPIKSSELQAETKVDFNVMIMMPLNRKVLPVLVAGSTLTTSKLQKLKEATELYVKRADIKNFRKYVEANLDKSTQSINTRCRLKYLELCRAHTELMLLLIDESEVASFGRGKELCADCEFLARDLMMAMGTSEDPWMILNNSAIGETGTAERSTSFASMAGLLAVGLKKGSDTEVVMAGMLSDLGLLDLPPKIGKKIRRLGLSSLSAEEMKEYQQHPLLSLNRCLARRLPLPENVKVVISATHEMANGEGFPKQLPEARIPYEAFLIQFCQMVDQNLLVKMGEARKSVIEVQKQIIETDSVERKHFPLDLIFDIKRFLSI